RAQIFASGLVSRALSHQSARKYPTAKQGASARTAPSLDGGAPATNQYPPSGVRLSPESTRSPHRAGELVDPVRGIKASTGSVFSDPFVRWGPRHGAGKGLDAKDIIFMIIAIFRPGTLGARDGAEVCMRLHPAMKNGERKVVPFRTAT